MSDSAPTLTAELIVDGAVPRYPVISPDGRWVAFAVAAFGVTEPPLSALWVTAADGSSPPRKLTAAAARGRGPPGGAGAVAAFGVTEPPLSALWVTAADGSSPPRKLTAAAARDCVPRWAPDSASLFFGAGQQLHRIGRDGGPARALTTWRAGISDQWPLADGQVVAVVAVDEPTEEDGRRQAERDDAMVWGERVPYGRLRLLDLGTGALRVVDGLGDRHVVEVAERPDGGALAVISWACPDTYPGARTAELHVVDPETGAVHDLGRIELEARSLAWWSVAGLWHVAYLAVTPPGSVGGLAVFDLTVPAAGAAAEHRNLTADMTVCPTHLVQAADGVPLALFADGLDTAIYRLDPGVHRFQRVSTMDGNVNALSVDHSGGVVAVLAATSYELGDVYAGSPGGRFVRLSDTRPELRRIRWGTQERLSYQAHDGLGLDGLLILPPGRRREDGPFPLITLVHGGPSRSEERRVGREGRYR